LIYKSFIRLPVILIFFSFIACFSPSGQEKADSNKKSDNNKKQLRFMVFGDWGRNGEDHQRETAIGMGVIAKKFKPAFIVSTGDNFYPNGVRSIHDYNWIASFENVYSAHSLQTDWYVVLGNHDYQGNPQAEIDFSDVDRRWNMPSRYYSETFFLGADTSNAILCVFIDSTPFLSEYYQGSEHHVRGQDTAAQRIWLERTLAEAPANVKWKFVFGHHPLWTGGERMKAQETVELNKLLRPIFEKYHVNAYICGHEHNLQFIKPQGYTNYFISGSGSETTPCIIHPEGGQFAQSVNGFMNFTVFPGRLKVEILNYLGESLYSTIITLVNKQ
jgi:hypothetical protein